VGRRLGPRRRARPLVGGAVVEGIAWQWIFWLNVPVGLVLLPLARRMLSESHGPNDHLDLPGLALGGAGLLGLTFGIVRADALGWTSTTVVASLVAGVALLARSWRGGARRPAMLPPRFFAHRGFAATNGVSFAMFFGTFGSIFLLSQYFQIAQGLGPLEAGLRTLPWTGVPMIVAPIAGLLSDRIGSRPLMVAGLALQSVAMLWLALVIGRRRRSASSSCRSSWPGPAWRSSSRRAPTRCCRACVPRRPARRRGDEHDPRGRRRLGVAGAGERVRVQRRLREPRGVHRRRDRGAADRRGGARRGRGDRAARPRAGPVPPAGRSALDVHEPT
jgi:MFS family permease